MSSPMMRRMFGFCCCCAEAGCTVTKKASDAKRLRPIFLLVCMFSTHPSMIPQSSFLGQALYVLRDLQADEQFNIASDAGNVGLRLHTGRLALRRKLVPLPGESLTGLLLLGHAGRRCAGAGIRL